MAIGPEMGFILGPGPSWSLALPSADGLPAVFDSVLAGASGSNAPPSEISSLLAPWTVMTADEGWLVLAVAVTALEPLATFHERVKAALRHRAEAPGQLLPGPWEERRSIAREHGLAVDRTAMTELARCAERLGVAPPPDWAPAH
jgi:LDH2 family malate/lactate/ureidoglycolate dehydrogenase